MYFDFYTISVILINIGLFLLGFYIGKKNMTHQEPVIVHTEYKQKDKPKNMSKRKQSENIEKEPEPVDITVIKTHNFFN